MQLIKDELLRQFRGVAHLNLDGGAVQKAFTTTRPRQHTMRRLGTAGALEGVG